MALDRNFGRRVDGQIVTAHEIRSETGFKTVILNQGAILQALYLPDGRNVTLGFENWEAYETDPFYHGCLIGPNANRIDAARFEIDGAISQLTANEGAHNLHSGPNGFDRQLWDVKRTENGLELKHMSPDGHDGFPGDVHVRLHISLASNKLRLDMSATTSKPTPLNLTWHPYWNLNGVDTIRTASRIDGHDLQIASSQRTTWPSSDPISVKDTRFNFKSSLPLGNIRLDENYLGVDHAELITNDTRLTVTSSLPDMQIYTGDYLTHPRTAIAIEPQFRPNDINMSQRSLLRPGEIYEHWIEYKFELD